MSSATFFEPQTTGAVLMVRPAHFAFNPETAASNAFQGRPPTGPGADVGGMAMREFDQFAQQLDQAGVLVVVAEDTAVPVKPDAVFPNNWVSFHRDGTVVLYPMLAPNRRLERREEIVRTVLARGGFRASRTVDLSHRELQGQFLEGTGSLVLDRPNRIAYAGLSPRTDLDVLGEFAQLLDYDLVTFDASDAAGRPVYHTNVLMAVGSRFAVVCSEAVGPRHRDAVLQRLRGTGHAVLEISCRQMAAFAGNLIELAPERGPLIVVSRTAWQALDGPQRRTLEAHGAILAADVPVIEASGGGSVRCMLAEIHLPARSSGLP